jgi:hypothetical protein
MAGIRGVTRGPTKKITINNKNILTVVYFADILAPYDHFTIEK